MKIAIISLSGLFPGSTTMDEFWENLMQSRDLTGLATAEDFGVNPELFYKDGKGVVDKCYSLRGGYIRDFKFKKEGYQLDGDFLAAQDKLYLWSLQTAREALEDAGYLNQPDALRRCGLILGNLSFPTSTSHTLLAEAYTDTLESTLQEVLQDKNFKIPAAQKPKPNGGIIDFTPSELVTKALGLGGTHYALDAACATSLYAIKLACDELITGKADLMLAGAVCASDQLFIHMGFSIFHAYAPHDGTFVPLDNNSSGLVSSEGAGIVLLKRLEDAERDGDQILGVIAGTGLSNDGRGKFLLSPHPKGQKLAFERAYKAANLNPKNTQYLECHATGTPLGDKTEMNSIADFFEEHQAKPLLGSVKSNMGHLLTAAGMTGLAKVLLAMQKDIIPPNINLSNGLSSDKNWIGPEQMILEPTPWTDTHKQAGINSFGFGGTNAHLVVENYHKSDAVQPKIQSKLEPMSVIGMDIHFGDCVGVDHFYQTIFEGKQHFKSLPTERWKGYDANENLLKKYGFKKGKPSKGNYIESFELDLLRYKIQPKEAETLEPQQALILKVADQAIKDAGLKEGQNVAVLIAMESELGIHQYLGRWDVTWQLREALKNSDVELTAEQKVELLELSKNAIYERSGSQTPSQHTSFVGNIMASRIAALWDFSGPAFTVSCGDQSAFKALEIAQQMLSLGEVEAVVLGGVDFAGGMEHVLLRQQQYPFSEKDQPGFVLEENFDGILPGEGGGAIVLKRKSAVENTDQVYGDIQGKYLSNPDEKISMLEIPGGQRDPAAIQKIIQSIPTAERIAISSISSNIGHTYAASGIASLIKSMLCLSHKFIPAVPGWKNPKLKSSLEQQIYVPSTSRPWMSADTRKLAVSDGENQLWLVSESAETNVHNTVFRQQVFPKIIPLKCADATSAIQQLSALEIALQTEHPLAEIATQFYEVYQEKADTFTIVLLGKNKKSLLRELAFFKNKMTDAFENFDTIKTPSGSYFTANPLGHQHEVAFVYPGSSTTYPELGQRLFQLYPELYQQFGDLKPEMDTYVQSSYIYPKKLSERDVVPLIQNDAIAMMSSGVFFSACYTHLLRGVFDIQPDKAFGYSMGECSSMWYANGIWSADETSIFRNSPIFQNRFAGNLELLAEHWNISSAEAKERWVSLVLLTGKDQVLPLVEAEENVFLTFINTENEVIISGDREKCNQVVQKLKCQTIELPFQNVIHHDFCKKEHEGLVEMHDFELQEESSIEFYSSITGTKIPFDRKAIAKNSTIVCEQQVDFPKTVNTIYESGARIFIEVGANATCTGWINSILDGKEFLSISINQKGKTDEQSIASVLAQLISHGLRPNLSGLFHKAETKEKKKSFYKNITPGGGHIFKKMQEASVRANFKNISKKKNIPVLQEAFESSTPIVESPILTTNTYEKTPLFMDTNIATPTKTTTQSRIGENGLKLQNYESGEQFEGKTVIFSQEDLVEFATGSIAKVFGSEYSIIDQYRRRVMLPMDPYLLVSRVTGLNAKLGEYKPSTMQTEYDIPYNAWFTTDKQIPWAVSVESGQCDLMLISYLGIDLQNKGDLVYRLLDCTLTFVDDLPYEGQTLRYDISINSFVENGDNLLFFFSYRCYVQDRLVLKMDGGCAGFFTDEQLEEGNGVVYSDGEKAARANAEKQYFTPLLDCKKTAFTKDDLRHLINADPVACFGDQSYHPNGRNTSLRLPPEKILMLDRIVSVDTRGGAYGLGMIIAEKDLNPDDWYFPCHFRDDEVLAGSLQAEGGGNLLRFYMMMLGLQRLTKDARFQPVFDLPQKVRCRKQVTPKDTKLVYKLEIKEIGLIPNPYVIGDLEIISDGVVTVHFENLGLQLREKDNPKYLEKQSGIYVSPRSEGALMNEADITTFALDKLSKCFGDEFKIYDDRTVSRQPNTDLQVISRILSIDGTRRDFSKPIPCVAEYDVPENAWYYQQNAHPTMPYSILMEVALQPCGLSGAYMGSTLDFPDKNLYFRNLDGGGEMFDLPMGTDFRGKVIKNNTVLASSVALGGTVLQNYTFELSIDGHVFYKGKSSFGFFPAEMLKEQVGLDGGQMIQPWYIQNNLATTDYMQIKLDSLYGKMKLFKAPENKPHYRLSTDQLNLLDKLIVAKGRGKYDQGYVHATRKINRYDWFFTCHFYQDPVMPGSLGVEAMMQALQTFVLQQGIGAELNNPCFIQLPNHKTVWKYRGQILAHVDEMQLELHIKSVTQEPWGIKVIADANLWNDEVRIYEVTDLGLGIVDK